jgi:serine/threonine protein kinase
VVYAARDTAVGCEVAIKLLVPPPAHAIEARERLRREVELVRGLRHPHILGVHDFLDEGGASFVVMDLVGGPDLARHIRCSGPLSVKAAVRLGREIASALGAAHRAGILHRDVKPENLLLEEGQGARLADFGSARLDGAPTLTATGALAGTLVYAAPEVLAGLRGDGRSDLYSLGMSLYEALTGRLPDHPRHLPPPPAAAGHDPRAITPSIPAWLGGLVARATAAAPAERFPTMAEFEAALARGEMEEPLAAKPAARRARCLVCGGGALPGSPVCGDCHAEPPRRTRFLFVRHPAPQLEAAVAELVASDPSVVARGPLGDAATGRRALIRVPADSALGLAEWLADRGVRTDPVTAPAILTRLPLSFHLLVLGGAAAGVGVGLTVAGAGLFLYASPVVTALLLSSACREVARPALVVDRGRRGSPAAVISRLRQLGPGPARDLFAAVVRQVRELLEREPAGPSRERLAGELAPLAEAAAGVAGELELVDRKLERLRDEAGAQRRLPLAWWTMVTETEGSRDRLAQTLLELISALDAAASAQSLAFTAPLAGLGELTREFAGRLPFQAAAREEVASLG